jgi:hypothetical protein
MEQLLIFLTVVERNNGDSIVYLKAKGIDSVVNDYHVF